MMTTFIFSVVLLAVLGILIGILLGVAGKFFAVETDERVVQVRDCLPGNNCGGCGYPGCDGLAEAIVAGDAEVNGCPVGGATVAANIGAILGVEAGEAVRQVAYVKCAGTCDIASNKYNYVGEMDCRRAVMVPGRGDKACAHGCLGLGSCVEACQFGALSIQDGIAVVNKELCVACGKCVATCPNGVISLIPYESSYAVQCNSKDKGKEVMGVCKAGCIGCSLCVKQCEFDAVKVENNIAVIDAEKCQGCGKCAEKCPKKIIRAVS
ncbi:MAG: RnfABCDGE type electron transport complex subunit B [Lachnospiraceae bacterium]|nr:RnfABCDGE type electron transport complex subunit B [Lachnospiraceae bacterium]